MGVLSKMKVLYFIGKEINRFSYMQRGNINENKLPLKLEADDEIVFDNIKDVSFYSPNGLSTFVKIQNGEQTVFLCVPTLFIDIGTGFIIINRSATKKLKAIIDS